MIIKKWTGSAWEAQSPNVTLADIYTDTSFNTQIFDSNSKLKTAYLPDFAFGGMKFVSTVTVLNASPEYYLRDLIDENIGDLDIATNLIEASTNDNITQFSDINSTTYKELLGYYFIAGESIGLLSDVSGTASYGAAWDDGVDLTNNQAYLEPGDWIVVTGWDASDGLLFSVVNNTYNNATSSNYGVVKLGSNTVQSVAENSVSTGAGRTYAIQNNSSGRLVVNVPWENTNTTYSAGDGIGLTGTTFSVAAGSGLTQDASGLSHADTSSASSSSNAGRTYIQSITLDGFGHITAIGTGTETVTDTTYTAGSGISLSGTQFSVAAGGGLTQDASGLSHSDTSTVSNLTASGRTYVTGLTFDTYGHVTGLTTGTETVVNTDTTYSAGNGISLSGTTFSVAAGAGLTQNASGLGMDMPIWSGTVTPAADYEVTNAIWFDLN